MRLRPPTLALASSLGALLGAVAGWFWYQLLANPLVGLAGPGHAENAAAAAALAGALAGPLLVPAPEHDLFAPRRSPARLPAIVLSAGAFAGAIAAALQAPERLGHGAGVGALCAVPLLPAAALAVTIVRRAGRARRGSVVARADGRAVVGAAAAILGCISGLALLEWPAAGAGAGAPPLGAVALLAASAAVVAGVLLADLAALARVDRWAAQADALSGEALVDVRGFGSGRAGPTPRTPDSAPPPAKRVDFGLGDGIAAPQALGTAYRGGGRALACVLGDAGEAAAALRQSVRRGAALLALLEVVAFAHGAARETEVAAHYGAWLCDEGDAGPATCRAAALVTERAGLPGLEAAHLHDRACGKGQEESCHALVLLHRLALSY